MKYIARQPRSVIHLSLCYVHMEHLIRIIIQLAILCHQLPRRGCRVDKSLKSFVWDSIVESHKYSGADRHSSQETDVVQMCQSDGD